LNVPRTKTEGIDDALVRYANSASGSHALVDESTAYQEKLQKMQKKIAQFEAYIEEKDRTILE
jgi:Skp family chaperone for outer membrane proteins